MRSARCDAGGKEGLEQIVRRLFFTDAEAFEHFVELIFEVVQLFQDIILASFQFIEQVARFVFKRRMAGKRRHRVFRWGGTRNSGQIRMLASPKKSAPTGRFGSERSVASVV